MSKTERKSFEELTLEEAKQYGEYRILDTDSILEDPDNRAVFGEYKTDGLTMSISENGFQGAVLVYPWEGKYRLQSGHRSLEASIRAGLKKIPAIVSDPPATEAERRKKLIIPNTHERLKSPMCMAHMVQYHYDTLFMEREEKRKNGEKGRTLDNLTKKVAEDLEISTAQVTKYRALLKLIPELQKLLEDDIVSWSSLVPAAGLDSQIQSIIARRIRSRMLLAGKDSVTREWLKNEIEECGHIRMKDEGERYRFDRNDTRFYPEKEMPARKEEKKPDRKRRRRGDAAKAIRNSFAYLKKAWSDETFFREEDKKESLKLLKEMQKSIEEKIKELEKS